MDTKQAKPSLGVSNRPYTSNFSLHPSSMRCKGTPGRQEVSGKLILHVNMVRVGSRKIIAGCLEGMCHSSGRIYNALCECPGSVSGLGSVLLLGPAVGWNPTAGVSMSGDQI